MKNQQFARVGKITPSAFYKTTEEVKSALGIQKGNIEKPLGLLMK